MVSTATKPPIIVICGPTGIGKTTAAIEAAEKFNGEIISADSMQIYRMMEIGTAKPSHEECRRVPHHMIDIADPDEPFDAARFAEKARKIIFDLHRRGVVPFVAGGTGLYIKALVHGLFQADPPDPETRRQIKAEVANLGSDALHNRLTQVDPEAAERIHPNDRFRIVRALEMHAVSGVPLSEHHREHSFRDSPFRVLNIGLTMDREALYARIDSRVDAMITAGLEGEVSWLLKSGYSEELKSMQSIGYRHMIAYLTRHMPREEALRTMKRDTRRYAKRQMTWFKAVADIVWIEPNRIKELYPRIEAFLK